MDEKSKRIISWFKENGGIFNNIEIVYTDDMGYDLKLAKQDQPFELKIPSSLIINKQKCIDCNDLKWKHWLEAINDQFNHIDSIPGKLVLKLFILYHKLYQNNTETSFWNPYIDILPKQFNSPICWPEEKKSALKWTSLDIPLTSQTKSLRQQYFMIQSIDEIITWEEWIWSDRVVNSRVWEVPVDEDKTEFALIPLLDLVNHDENPNCFWEPEFTSDEGNQLPNIQIYYKQDSQIPDQSEGSSTRLTFSYGSKEIDSWVFSHGFIPNNIEPPTSIMLPNILLLSPDSIENDKFHNAKVIIMQLNELSPIIQYTLQPGIFDNIDILAQAYISQLNAEDGFTTNEEGQLFHSSLPGQSIFDLNEIHQLLIAEGIEQKYRQKFLEQLKSIILESTQKIQVNANNFSDDKFLTSILNYQLEYFNQLIKVIDNELNSY
ncbi:SET domain-containing protein [Conidiobolus coronatus NRRL 28638]|uniref:SET domain-containing protein n=1 Tax=Conidiobolus coronatus (strain ATCC 28846 / CBS 209.66 / NRRL 28638) TaxID=796925 RepID=A0A137PCJ1_CONC2|nr:SET domain-containing protein [Conidiobolus coronatus NRRL 28638]|eukprot:KXN72716.1 SET domain-containing protein [Conidiobolus coronatus NRRL 28638]